jgi:sugar lactone lactonase YvrE
VFADVGYMDDGMTVDHQGHLYLTTSQGIEIISPEGIHWRMNTPSNCTFGGEYQNISFLTGRESLYKITFDL